MRPEHAHYGSAPRKIVDPEIETWRRALDSDEALAAAWKVSNNAYKHYYRVRGVPVHARPLTHTHARMLTARPPDPS